MKSKPVTQWMESPQNQCIKNMEQFTRKQIILQESHEEFKDEFCNFKLSSYTENMLKIIPRMY